MIKVTLPIETPVIHVPLSGRVGRTLPHKSYSSLSWEDQTANGHHHGQSPRSGFAVIGPFEPMPSGTSIAPPRCHPPPDGGTLRHVNNSLPGPVSEGSVHGNGSRQPDNWLLALAEPFVTVLAHGNGVIVTWFHPPGLGDGGPPPPPYPVLVDADGGLVSDADPVRGIGHAQPGAAQVDAEPALRTAGRRVAIAGLAEVDVPTAAGRVGECEVTRCGNNMTTGVNIHTLQRARTARGMGKQRRSVVGTTRIGGLIISHSF